RHPGRAERDPARAGGLFRAHTAGGIRLRAARAGPALHAQPGGALSLADFLGLVGERAGRADGGAAFGDLENRLRSPAAAGAARRIHRALTVFSRRGGALTSATEPMIRHAASKMRAVRISLPIK